VLIDHALALPAYYILTAAEASSELARYDGLRYGTVGLTYPLVNQPMVSSLGQVHSAPESQSGYREWYTETRNKGLGPEVKRRILIGSHVLSRR
jgi:aspartyl-tRNA(Asn)/glutamyl-tRNA(Gln) amidotransferase subunit A